jgi:hypothetical protein
MAIDYTAWPLVADVQGLLAASNVTLGAGTTSDYIDLRIKGAVDELTKRTHRQFLTTTETRNFDGSGTGEMVVDEYRTITSITLYLIPTMSVVEIIDFVQVERATFPQTRIQIYQGPVNVPFGWFTRFPEGRSNVGITGTWGYADTIPADVWEAVAMRAAAKLADANRLNQNGVVTDVKDDDQDVKWGKGTFGEMSGWDAQFDAVCERYRRPLRNYLAQRKPGLV